MKLALCQLNFTIGDFLGNAQKIITTIQNLKNQQVDLVIFSELCISGYPPMDLLDRNDFIEQCQISLNNIASHTKDIAIIVGSPVINPNEKGKKLYNAAVFIENGEIQSYHYKTLLPDYDVFDEYRYFEPANEWNVIHYKNQTLAITICEDLWDTQPINKEFERSQLYIKSPVRELMKQNPDFFINIAASPFSNIQNLKRNDVLQKHAIQCNKPFLYINQVGAHTDLIFDGGSIIIGKQGNIIEKSPYFTEHISIIESSDLFSDKNEKPHEPDDIEMMYHSLVLGIRDYFSKNGFSKAVIGLSGGIDSAIVATLAVAALGNDHVTGILMPSQYSSNHSISDALDLAKNLNIRTETIPIKDIYLQFTQSLNPWFKDLPEGVSEENIQARIRGTLLMAWSNKFGAILLNTTNKSEMAVGYGTLYGDMNGALSVIGDVYKSKIYELAAFINSSKILIPLNTITKPPSAELRPDQKDSDSLPDYAILDAILEYYIEYNLSEIEIIEKGYDLETVKKVIRLINLNEYKRYQAAPVIRVTSKAFGPGRRIPLARKF